MHHAICPIICDIVIYVKSYWLIFLCVNNCIRNRTTTKPSTNVIRFILSTWIQYCTVIHRIDEKWRMSAEHPFANMADSILVLRGVKTVRRWRKHRRHFANRTTTLDTSSIHCEWWLLSRKTIHDQKSANMRKHGRRSPVSQWERPMLHVIHFSRKVHRNIPRFPTQLANWLLLKFPHPEGLNYTQYSWTKQY